MSDSPSLSTLALPPDLDAEDVLGLRDQLRARLTAIVTPKGRKRAGTDIVLPEGVELLDALPPHIDRPWQRFDAAATELQTFRGNRASAQADEALSASDLKEQDAANADADDRWRALEHWNSGAAGLAEDGAAPSPAEARWLYAQIFEGSEALVTFLLGPYVEMAIDLEKSRRATRAKKPEPTPATPPTTPDTP